MVQLDGSDKINLTSSNANNRHASFSPNGESIVFESDRDGNKEVYIMNLDGSDQINISNHDSVDTDIKFSPDGLNVAWISNRDGNNEIYITNTFDNTSVVNISKNFGFDFFVTFQPWW